MAGPPCQGDGVTTPGPELDYLAHLRDESARFLDALHGGDLAREVPTCPDWSAADLLWHLSEVQWFWGTIVRERLQSPDDLEPPGRPGGDHALMQFFEEQSARLLLALTDADPAEPVYTWSEDKTVGFIRRRQAHEALIHRLDAEQTAGAVTPLDPALAADGVDEALDVMFGGTPAWGRFDGGGGFVRVDITDQGESVWVETGRFTGTDPESGQTYDEDDISKVEPRDGEPDVVVSGSAAVLDAWLWGRGDDSAVSVTGDDTVSDHFRRCVNQAIN